MAPRLARGAVMFGQVDRQRTGRQNMTGSPTTSEQLQEAIRTAKAAHAARLEGLGVGKVAALEIRRAYAGGGYRATNMVVSQALKVVEAIEELERRIAAV